mgnify:CR=1 FL=1
MPSALMLWHALTTTLRTNNVVAVGLSFNAAAATAFRLPLSGRSPRILFSST